MISREELLRSLEYWFEAAQNELFRQVRDYMKKEHLNQAQLAAKLNVSKGYVSQILNGNFNYTLKKHIELALAIKKVPVIRYRSLQSVIDRDSGIKLKRGGRNGLAAKSKMERHNPRKKSARKILKTFV